ncbi:MAG: hypothetical protein WC511_07145 [Candidatus Pacearchaeota archaeon]|jgi:hypothetical protein
MSSIDGDYPQFLYIDKDIKEKYLEPLIKKGSGTCFEDQEMGEIYLLGAVIGYINKLKSPIKSGNRKEVRTYGKLSDDNKLLIRCIAIESNNYEYPILFEGTKVLKLLEEYANAGIKVLSEKIFNNLNLSIEDEIEEFLQKI